MRFRSLQPSHCASATLGRFIDSRLLGSLDGSLAGLTLGVAAGLSFEASDSLGCTDGCVREYETLGFIAGNLLYSFDGSLEGLAIGFKLRCFIWLQSWVRAGLICWLVRFCNTRSNRREIARFAPDWSDSATLGFMESRYLGSGIGRYGDRISSHKCDGR